MSTPSVTPLVSIIMPNYNNRKYIAEAMESVLNQTYTNWELIVIDDGSMDNSVEIIQAYAAKDERIRLLVNATNKGVSASRNEGLKNSNGAFICFLDSDDVFLPNKLSDQVECLQQNSAAGLVYSDQLVSDDKLNIIDKSEYFMPSLDLKEFMSIRNLFSTLTVMLRRKLMEQVGYFDSALSGGEDWDYWIRCSEKTPFIHLKINTAIYRQHVAQSHNNITKMKAAREQVIKKHFNKGRVKHLALGAHYWTWARMSNYHKKYLLTFWYLVQMFYHARTVKNLKTIFSEYNK